ncbi:SusD/RagB family nutrient-binding outer membrane lipoprotein [Hymenobacter busanensis]|uniref:SusD/RagB family nutrient-binding outer membrane lipoprotein n=1 Tax=Hymenobacter busanensis TaxID=2607656 RepID=A0A7L4ZWN3_9BACT|nr:SusD/RagB family nutrient-binding outer membrane lipoprotein [Hymenobacter busanensis]KAA9327164.1 SusD/RagB family nutrient-binding outer membrane lipoprotein [Hymenobacter busanensis]QHJ05830.1 SusD/RagB family nutrient-binding outer membrane lipoprotein [Hymenobacter busanensis]
MKKQLFRLGAVLGLLLGSSACEKDFLDINKDPNNSTTADINLVLPSGQAFVSFIVGGQYNVVGEILAQHLGIAQGGNQYRAWDQFSIPTSTFDGREFSGGIYAGALDDFQYVINAGTPAGEWRMVGIAKILQAHAYQVTTDLYGDIPFSEALQGSANLTPKYDRQQDIYAGLQQLLDEGIADIAKQQGRFPGTADLNYRATTEADMQKWVRFANTLKLRLYLHMSEVDPTTARNGIQALYNRNASATDFNFMRSGDSFQFANGTATNTENPFYQTNFRLQNNLAVSSNIGDTLVRYQDPRLPVYALDADLTTTPQEFLFVRPGQNAPYPNNFTTSTGVQTVRLSYPGTYFIGQAFTNVNRAGSTYAGITATDAPAKSRPTLLLTYEESQLLRAEAAVRGWAPSGENAQTLYENGVRASLTRFGVSAADAATYLTRPQVSWAAATTPAAQLRNIFVQKWLSFFGTNGAEAWTEVRRTNQPRLQAPLVNLLGGGRFVKRLPYPDSELQRNPNVAATGLTPGDITTPVWWDVN